MAFVTYKLENNARRVEMVYKTQAEATSAASGDVLAFTGSVNDNVEPGRYISSTGALLSSVPAATRDAGELLSNRALISEAFLTGENSEPRWQRDIDDSAAEYLKAASRWRYLGAALADRIAAQQLFSSFNRNTRNNTVEHIVKEIRTSAYSRMAGLTKSVRDNWVGAGTGDGANIYSDILNTNGSTRTPDGRYTQIPSATIPANYNPGGVS